MTVRGIDVSRHQTPSKLNYSELAKTHAYVIVRAAYGRRKDEHFLDHIARAKAVGLSCGAYLFLRGGQDPAEQAEMFGEQVDKAGMGQGWLPPALDCEANEKYDGPFTKERYDDQAHAIADMWEAKWGTALIYTNPSDWITLGSPKWITGFLLWIAQYSTRPPTTPHKMPWALWQHSGTGRLPGVYDGDLDLNVAEQVPVLGSKAGVV